MKELLEIVEAWDAVCSDDGQEVILATVVQVSGSTYRRPGARMLLSSEGRLAGSVSGGCLEGDILKKAWWLTRHSAALVTYDSTDDDDLVWGFGLGCNGVVQVLLERVSPASPGPLELLQKVLASRLPAVVATVIGGDSSAQLGERLLLMPDGSVETRISDAALSLRVEEDTTKALNSRKSQIHTYTLVGGETAMVFLEVVLPPAPLVIFGANHDALPLVRIAKELGWHVTVVDTRSALPRPERFPLADRILTGPVETLEREMTLDSQTATVVMTHNYPDDKRILRRLLESSVPYIGQLGPRARTERLLAEISEDDFLITEEHRHRLHGPVGLDLGGETPEQIALSVIAEIQAVRSGRTGALLRDRQATLHSHQPLLYSDSAVAKTPHKIARGREICAIPA